jgi:hypothetical protein
MKVRTRRLARAVTLALCAAATFAGAAQAERPDDRAGLLGVGGADSAFRSEAVRPDDRAGLLGVGNADAQPASVRPDDRGGVHGPGAAGQVQSEPPPAATDGFHWDDAFLGMAATLALLLFGAALALTIRSRGRVILP